MLEEDDVEDDNEEDWMAINWENDPQENLVSNHPHEPSWSSYIKSERSGDENGRNFNSSDERSKNTDNGESKKTTADHKPESSLMSRMLLNDNKAGMEGLDKEKINQIIFEASKGNKHDEDEKPGSKYFENEKKKEEQVNKRIEEQRQKKEKITAEQLETATEESDRLLEEFDRMRDLSRTIVHIDMDAFYAAVETRDDPTLKDKPMAVGGLSMLSTSNYHARKYGVRAAMPGFIGKKLCPNLTIVPLNFDKYTSVSKQVKQILMNYDPNFCPVSLDEAYLDMTDHMTKRASISNEERFVICRKCDSLDKSFCLCDLNETLVTSHQTTGETVTNHKVNMETCSECGKPVPPYESVLFGVTVEDAVEELRSRIQQKTRLTASAGIAPNMMLAKVCSDRNKPNGQYRIQPTVQAVMEFIKDLPTRKISGIGKVTEKMLNSIGVRTCRDLYEKRALLYHLYSQISFNYFMRICLGIGSTTVERDGERKSMSTERTFSELKEPKDLYNKCFELCESLSEDLKLEQLKGRTVSIKLKTVKFDVRTRAFSLQDYTSETSVIYAAAKDLLNTEIQNCKPLPLRLRLMGVRMSSLINQNLCKKKQNTLTEFVKKSNKPEDHKTTPAYSCENLCEDLSQVHDRDVCEVSGGSVCSKNMTNSEGVHQEPYCTTNVEISDTRETTLEKVTDSQLILDTREITPEKVTDNQWKLLKSSEDQTQESLASEKSILIHNHGKNTGSDDVGLSDRTSSMKSETYCDTTVIHASDQGVSSKSDTNYAHNLVEKKEHIYTCPVCQDELQCQSLREFNQHIDMCLSRSLVKECSKYRPEDEESPQSKTALQFKVVGRSEDNKSKHKGTPKRKQGTKFKSLISKSNDKGSIKGLTKTLVNGSVEDMSEKGEISKSPFTSSKRQIESDAIQGRSENANECNQINVTPKRKRETKNATRSKIARFDDDQNCGMKTKESSQQKQTLSKRQECDYEIPHSSEVKEELVCPVCFMEQSGTDLELFNQHVDSCLCKGTINEILQEQNTHSKRESIKKDKGNRKRPESGIKSPSIASFFKGNSKNC